MELDKEQIKANQQKIINLLNTIDREGIVDLINFLQKSDFFTAPASTRFHLSIQGGLALHSLHVYECLQKIKYNPIFEIQNTSEESIILVSLLHDICKVNFYSVGERNVKDENGKWIKVPMYQVDNQIVSVGEHGDKSLMMISEFIKLKPEEKAAIRWHMGAYEGNQVWNTLGLAFERYPLAYAMHVADALATHRIESIE